ncbi:MAG TPA: ATP-binding protein [Stellaceae bacterium]|nr:ATP-binding protein [Stellaceae bacterium]
MEKLDETRALAFEPANEATFLADGGEMGALIRAKDWSRTRLGPPETWPQSLQTAVGIMLNSRYAMFVWWGRHLINLYNDAYRPFLGTKHPDALGKSAREVWSEIWDLIGPRTETVLDRGESTFDKALLLVMERFGYPEETYFTFSYSPIRTDRGKIGGLFCAVTDETSRVIGERRLRLLREVAADASENLTPGQVCEAVVRCISRSARDLPFAAIYLTEPGGKLARLTAQVGWNDLAALGEHVIDMERSNSIWPLAEAGRADAPFIVPNLQDRFGELPKGDWNRAPTQAAIVPLARQGQPGHAGYLIAGLNPYRPLDEEYRGFLTVLAGQVAAGIANARAYQVERKRAEALAEIDRAKTAFFSNVSHEFRTPLTLLLSPLEEALAAPPASLPERRQDLALAHRSGLRLLRLVNTLLDFSRIEAGRVEASYEPTDLAAFTADLASTFRAATDKAGLRLIVECPPLSEAVWIDREMWEKIVLNPLSNAFKFTFEGSITVRLRETHDKVILEIIDTGIGIPADEVAKVFDRFHRVEGARGRTHEGSGIGLALVQELVKLHGGTVGVESIHGVGSTFSVAIPRGTAHLPQDRLRGKRTLSSTGVGALPYVEEALRWLPESVSETPAEIEPGLVPAPPIAVPASGRRQTVLVVDDNSDMREYLRRLLASRYEVQTAGDGVAALAVMRRRRPDLLLSDVMMPRLDGFGLVREVRADLLLADLPIVLLSARAGEEASIEGLEAGADDYLIKPFSARELLARVAANLKMARMRTELEQQIAADLQAMRRLHELGLRCLRQGEDVDDCLTEILDLAIAVTGADKGNIQLLDTESGTLRIAVQRGFEKPFLDFFSGIGEAEAGACSAALQSAERVVVYDVMQSESFAGKPALGVLLEAGVRALQSTPLTSADGSVLGMISTHFSQRHRPSERELHLIDLLARQAADYLGRAHAEATLRTTREQLQAMLQSSPHGVFLVDDRLRIQQVNPTALAALGDIPDLVGRDLAEVMATNWSKAAAEEMVTRIRSTLETGEQCHVPEWLGHRAERGTAEYYEWQIARIPLPEGRYGVVGHFRDISASVHARHAIANSQAQLRELNERLEQRVEERSRALIETERRFRLLVDAVADYSIFMLDTSGHVINWNSGARRIKGYAREEIVGKHFSVFYTEEERSEGVPHKALATALQTGRHEVEGWRVRKDGGRFWASAVINAVHDSDGQLVGFAKITRDLTEKRAAEERLRQAQKMEAIGQLTGGIAHDFNNLLTVISGNVEMLQRRLDSAPADLRRLASSALHGTERAAVLTQRLLAFSRQQALEPKLVRVGKLISNMSEMLRRTLGESIAIETVLAGGLWPIFVDVNQLENAILNLAINARDAMPDGGKLTIEAANVQLGEDVSGDVSPGEYVGIFVSDTGIGMAPETAAKAFDPFFTTKAPGHGTGLGLSQVYGFIRQSEGQVRIHSELGAGTTVKLYLPRHVAADGAAEVTPSARRIPYGSGETILVVDDEAEVRSSTVEMLRELGYVVVDAPDGATGLRLLDAHPETKLLLTDVGLPGGMNGRQVADEAKRRRNNLRVLFTSGYARSAIVHHGRLDPGRELLAKPFSFSALATRVHALLTGAS